MTLREYMDRVCLCGQPRARHVHASAPPGMPKERWIRVIGGDACQGFTDRIEQQLSGLGAFQMHNENPDQELPL